MKLVVVRRNIFLTVTQTSIHRYIANTMFFYLELNIEKKEKERERKNMEEVIKHIQSPFKTPISKWEKSLSAKGIRTLM